MNYVVCIIRTSVFTCVHFKGIFLCNMPELFYSKVCINWLDMFLIVLFLKYIFKIMTNVIFNRKCLEQIKPFGISGTPAILNFIVGFGSWAKYCLLGNHQYNNLTYKDLKQISHAGFFTRKFILTSPFLICHIESTVPGDKGDRKSIDLKLNKKLQ